MVLNCILCGIKKVGCQALGWWVWPLLCPYLVWWSHDPKFTFRSGDDTWDWALFVERGLRCSWKLLITKDLWAQIIFTVYCYQRSWMDIHAHGPSVNMLYSYQHVVLSAGILLRYGQKFSKKATTPKFDCSWSVTHMRRTLSHKQHRKKKTCVITTV